MLVVGNIVAASPCNHFVARSLTRGMTPMTQGCIAARGNSCRGSSVVVGMAESMVVVAGGMVVAVVGAGVKVVVVAVTGEMVVGVVEAGGMVVGVVGEMVVGVVGGMFVGAGEMVVVVAGSGEIVVVVDGGMFVGVGVTHYGEHHFIYHRYIERSLTKQR